MPGKAIVYGKDIHFAAHDRFRIRRAPQTKLRHIVRYVVVEGAGAWRGIAGQLRRQALSVHDGAVCHLDRQGHGIHNWLWIRICVPAFQCPDFEHAVAVAHRIGHGFSAIAAGSVSRTAGNGQTAGQLNSNLHVNWRRGGTTCISLRSICGDGEFDCVPR